jgi:membrane fusion protein (multidrug efflux system)
VSAPPVQTSTRPPQPTGRPVVPFVIGAIVVLVVVLGAAMVWRAESKTNKVALASSAKPVTVIKAVASHYQPTRTYVGTLEPWVEAKIGPQMVSAYVDTVLVRPGAVVHKGDVLATLDCRNASATSQAVAMEARALDARQKAISHEATRLSSLLDGGFVSANEAEQKEAQSAAEEANLLAQKAKLLGTSLEVNDCILRSPFDGDVGAREADPGAFVHPGDSIVSVVDRGTVRLVAAVPENDFDVVAPENHAHIHVFATGAQLDGAIARRAPSADPGTRTIHVEIDIADPSRSIPVYTTGEITLNVGQPVAATELPLSVATIRGAKATVFVIEGNVAHSRTFKYLGEAGGSVFVDTSLAPNTLVVSEGRALLADKDHVTAKVDEASAPVSSAPPKSGKGLVP